MNIVDEILSNSNFDVNMLIPEVRVKLRDKLCFKGCKVDYKDFTLFILRDGQYIPFIGEEQKEDDKVIDFLPLICVGVAEIVGVIGTVDGGYDYRFYLDMLEGNCFESFEDALKLASGFGNCDFNGNSKFASLLNLRYYHQNFAKGITKNIVNSLYIMYFANPKKFAEIVLDAMHLSFPFISQFTTPPEKLKVSAIGRSYESSLEVASRKDVLKSCGNLEMGRFEYVLPNSDKKHSVSDGRGLGITSFVLLMNSVYSKFSEKTSKYTLNIGFGSSSLYEYCLERFKSCLGDDFVGKYYSGKRVSVKDLGDSNNYITRMIQLNIFPIMGNQVYKIDSEEIPREMYENALLIEKAYGIKDCYDSDLSLYYTNPMSLVREIMFILNNQDCVSLFNSNNLSERILNEAKRVAKEMTAIDEARQEELIRSYECEIQSYKEQLDFMKNKYDSKIEELQRIISSKTDIIEQLGVKVSSLNEVVTNTYSDDDFIENDSIESVSIESKVEFLADFTITLIGGRDDLGAKLNQRGLSKLVQVSSERSLNGTPHCSDFIVLNTQFCSHKVVNCVRERYKDDLSSMMYYNGTNVDGLINALYDFVISWFNKEN